MRENAKLVAAALTVAACQAGATPPTITSLGFYTEVWGPGATFEAADAMQLFANGTSDFAPEQILAVATYSLNPSMSLTLWSNPAGGIFTSKNFNIRIDYSPSLTSAWNLLVTDPNGSASAVFGAIADPELLPLVVNPRVIQDGSTPTIAWDLPDLTDFDVDRIQVRAIDSDTRLQFFQSSALAPSTTSFKMPSGLLQVGKQYEFRVILSDDVVPGVVENRSNTFTGDVALVPEPSQYLLLAAGLAAVFGVSRPKRRAQGNSQGAVRMPKTRFIQPAIVSGVDCLAP